MMKHCEWKFRIVKFLIENGANDSLLSAVQNNCMFVDEYLIEHGADIHKIKNKTLIYAIQEGYLEVMKFLIDNDIDIRAKNDALVHIKKN